MNNASPVFGVTTTVIAYALAVRLYRRFPSPLTNPLLLSAAALMGILAVSRIPYDAYAAGGQLLSFWLGPATVALAVPLARQLRHWKLRAMRMLLAVSVGASASTLSAWMLAEWLGASQTMLRSILPKSITTPIAVEVARILDGIPPLTATLVIVTGLLGSLLGTELLRFLGFRDPAVTGLALGTTSHGIGTARALQQGAVAGGASSLAMGWAGIWISTTLALARLLGWL